MPQPVLSIVLPCLNEERTLRQCIEQAKQCFTDLGMEGEVVVADNGSTDSSAQIAESCNAKIVPVATRGYGAALTGGIQAASGKYVVMGDADMSYDFSANSLKPYLAELESGADLVMGSRFKGGIAKGAMPPLHQYFGTPLMTWMVNFLFATRLSDINCGLRGFKRESIIGLGLKSTGMEFASEMVIKSAKKGLLIKEVPTTLKPDGRDRKPHLRSFRDGLRHFALWLKLCF